MSESKNDKILPFAYNPALTANHPMNQYQDITYSIVPFLTKKDVASVMCAMKSNYLFYKPILEKKKKVEKALTYVVQGDVISLIALLKDNLIHFPSLVFEKYGEITAPRGQTYYNVSVYQLMTFLCDKDMKLQAMSLIPERFNEIRKAQYAQIDCGGADIIKLDRNPLEIMESQGFEGFTHYITTYTLADGAQQEVLFPLLENQDGIICYQDENNKKQFYYANQENQIILSFEDCIIAENEATFEKFKKSFDAMENNSGRRSSEEEHQMIAKVLNISLVRKGIFYSDNGILYRDSYTPFKLVNAYRKCMRLYREAEKNDMWRLAHHSWKRGVGSAQGEEIWLLQRICEENRSFYPLKPESFADFKRGCKIYTDFSKSECVFENGVINIPSAICRGVDERYRGAPDPASGCRRWLGCAEDVLAICWLIEDAKAQVIEFKPEQEVQMSCTIR